MDWARILAYMTGTVDQELLGRNGMPGGREPHHEGPAERSTEAARRRGGNYTCDGLARVRDRWIPGPFPPPLPSRTTVSGAGMGP